jgi:hypothetical protein
MTTIRKYNVDNHIKIMTKEHKAEEREEGEAANDEVNPED